MNIEEKLDKGRVQVINDMIFDEFMQHVQANKAPFDTLMAYYRCAIMEIETKFRVLDEEFSLQYDRNPIESIKSRIKSNESLIRKMRQKNIPMNLEAMEANIYDVAGIRVICSFPEDIYMLADCLLKQDDITLIEIKDYIKNPKDSGYRSLHLIVEVPIFLKDEKRSMKVEVQLRTIAMDFWASLDHKLRYKKNISPELAQELTAELKECAEASAELDRKMENIKYRIGLSETEEIQTRRLPIRKLLKQIRE